MQLQWGLLMFVPRLQKLVVFKATGNDDVETKTTGNKDRHLTVICDICPLLFTFIGHNARLLGKKWP